MTQIRFQKCWQLTDPVLVVQINLKSQLLENEGKWIKAFLIADVRQSSFGVSFSSKKPPKTKADTALINTLRKNIGEGRILKIEKEPSGNIWLVIGSSQKVWYILLEKSRPPQISLMDEEGLQFLRYGQKGTFTKKKSFEGELFDLNDSKFDDLLPSLMEDYIDKESVSKEVSKDSEASALASELDDTETDTTKSKEQKQLKSRLKRKLKTLKKSYEKQKSAIPTKEEISTLEYNATLLRSYSYRIKENDFEFVLQPFEIDNEEKIVIELDPDRSVGRNIENYYQKIKKLKTSLEKGTQHLKKLSQEIANVERDIELCDTDLSAALMADLFKRNKLRAILPVSKTGSAPSLPYKVYKSSLGFRILVGKGPKENDILTKEAKSNDYWFHIAGITGTHVIVPSEKSIKEKIPDALLKEASILALHFSKSRDDFGGEVYFTKKHYLKKQKGMAPGLWKIEKSDTIYISYDQKDLEGIINSLEK